MHARALLCIETFLSCTSLGFDFFFLSERKNFVGKKGHKLFYISKSDLRQFTAGTPP